MRSITKVMLFYTILLSQLLPFGESMERGGALFAQYNQWIWMAGDNTTGQPGVYGTQGSAAPGNTPGARYEGVEWVDLQGKFWLFGGAIYSDLWKYDPVINQWAWLNGGQNQPPVYGAKGIPNSANTPGRRYYGSATCVDPQGKFWLFGGDGMSTRKNDLWKYDPTIPPYGEWAWMGGTQSSAQVGIFGTKGIPAAANYPGGRDETDAMWADAAGNIWLFGGMGRDGVGGWGYLNDLWKFDPVTLQWTWMSGSNLVNQTGVYGTQGTAAPANVPGARMVYASWKDTSGSFWIFGGLGSGGGVYDDLWKYDPITNLWTWMKGATGAGNINGTYGAKCIDAAANNPPAIYENRARWEDDCGHFWLWGGANVANKRNDLWRYSHTTGNWVWISGSNLINQAGVYGTKGISAPANMPGARGGNHPFRRPNTNELWFFGGGTSPDFNDMWKYVPDKPTASFTFNPNNACAPANVSFTNASTAGCNEIKSYAWNFGDPASGAGNTSSLTNPSHIFNTAGTYSVKLVVTNCTASKDSMTQTITVMPCGFTAIVASTSALCSGPCKGTAAASVSGGSAPYTYLWSSGQSTSTVSDLCTGNYTVTVTDGMAVTTAATASITSQAAISSGISSQANVVCNALCNGSATITASGGTPAYIYNWSSGGGTSSALTGLCAGNYICITSDASGCTTTQTVTITEPSALSTTLAITQASCGNTIGTATVSVSGGTAGYAYSWNTSPVQTNATATGLGVGSYTCIISDAGGCSKTEVANITSSGVPTVTLTGQVNILCNGASAGSATMSAAGGTLPYTYSWNTSPVQITAMATGLSAGGYVIIVTDGAGCSQLQVATITEPAAITSTVTSTPTTCNNNNGIAQVSSAGGTGSHSYTWNPSGGNTAVATGLAAGNYTVSITDGNGCPQSSTVIVAPSVGPSISLTAQTNVLCNGGNNGSATVTPSGGTPPYFYLWNTVPASASATATGLSSGIYMALVADAINCTQTQPVIITEPSTIAIQTSTTPTSCNSSNGIASATPGGGTPAYAYTWNNGQTTQTANALMQGTYTVLITDANNCSSTASVMVAEAPCPCPANLILTVPNAFSPNDDGENDEFCLQGGVDYCIIELTIMIYDRWGEKVYESNDKNFCWDAVPAGRQGTHNDKPQNTSVFVYSLKATLSTGEKVTKRGNVSLIL